MAKIKKRTDELSAQQRTHHQEHHQGEKGQHIRTSHPLQSRQMPTAERQIDERLPLMTGSRGWQGPVLLIILICGIGLASIASVAGLFYLMAGVVKGRFSTTAAMTQAPTFKPGVPAPATPGFFPWAGNLTGFARTQGYASYMHDLAGSLIHKAISRWHLGESLSNKTTASFPNPAPGHKSLSRVDWLEVCFKYAPFGAYATLLLFMMMAVGPEVVDLVDKMRAQNTEKQHRTEGRICKPSLGPLDSPLQANSTVPRKYPLYHEEGPDAKFREHIAIFNGLKFNKAKTHKLLQYLEKWDKVDYIRVNEDLSSLQIMKGCVLVSFASKAAWCRATLRYNGLDGKMPLKFEGKTIRMMPLEEYTPRETPTRSLTGDIAYYVSQAIVLCVLVWIATTVIIAPARTSGKLFDHP
ncbi:hypothetical protein VM1G_06517 [Cytospora mali]|uniref:Uncharacterized protein n=1 Tax=Cytospora mali TaxID=578113 RepID=A0A194W233_CYTMA|nr:hypothetical protein VM1G_06517 [Valsa mali]